MQSKIRQAALKNGWRSGLEDKVGDQLAKSGVSWEYETLTIPYRVEEIRRYTPDFILSNGIIVETKGRWVTADRKKIKLIRAQYPSLELRIVFSNPNSRISKTSKTTYAKFCESHGILFAKQTIPQAWLTEPPHLRSLETIALIRLEA